MYDTYFAYCLTIFISLFFFAHKSQHLNKSKRQQTCNKVSSILKKVFFLQTFEATERLQDYKVRQWRDYCLKVDLYSLSLTKYLNMGTYGHTHQKHSALQKSPTQSNTNSRITNFLRRQTIVSHLERAYRRLTNELLLTIAKSVKSVRIAKLWNFIHKLTPRIRLRCSFFHPSSACGVVLRVGDSESQFVQCTYDSNTNTYKI